MYRILLVEDDPGIAQAVCAHLRQWELDARCVQNFRAVMEEFTAFDPQLVLLDISLPFFNGYHWCTQIRAVSRVPVVFLSSASENMNIVMAMNMGADDFIAKPFDLDVLTAKVQALLRRTYDFAPAEPVLSHRGAVLQPGDQSLLVNGEKLPLSKNEYRILWTLLKEKGKIVSRERLMEALWQTDSFVDENTLSVNMARLRKKLDGAGLAGFIATRVGAGPKRIIVEHILILRVHARLERLLLRAQRLHQRAVSLLWDGMRSRKRVGKRGQLAKDQPQRLMPCFDPPEIQQQNRKPQNDTQRRRIPHRSQRQVVQRKRRNKNDCKQEKCGDLPRFSAQIL